MDETEKQFVDFGYEQPTSNILNMMSHIFPGPQAYCMVCMYKLYRLGSWKNKIPPPETFSDKEMLFWDDQGLTVLFHKKHEKFGQHILEWSDISVRNQFAFIDYASLEPAFFALNEGNVPPYIPMYYSHPHDRSDFKAGLHQWKDG